MDSLGAARNSRKHGANGCEISQRSRLSATIALLWLVAVAALIIRIAVPEKSLRGTLIEAELDLPHKLS